MHEVPRSKVILTGKVRHSQSVSEKPLKPWIAVEMSGSILCALFMQGRVG